MSIQTMQGPPRSFRGRPGEMMPLNTSDNNSENSYTGHTSSRNTSVQLDGRRVTVGNDAPRDLIEADRRLKGNIPLRSDAGRKALLEIFKDPNPSMDGKDILETSHISEFLTKGDNIKVTVTNDGKIVLSGIKASIPDMRAQYKKDLQEEVDNLYRINCKDKENTQTWMRTAIILLGIAVAALFFIGIPWLIYRVYYSSD